MKLLKIIFSILILIIFYGCNTQPKLPEYYTIRKINSYVNSFEYITDKDNYGKAEYFATPKEFFNHNGGDCEDYAIAKYYLLKKEGLKDKDFKFYVIIKPNKNKHMILVYKNTYYMSNGTNKLLKFKNLKVIGIFTPKEVFKFMKKEHNNKLKI